MQSQTVSVAWAHGMVSFLCCWLLFVLMIENGGSNQFLGASTGISENLTQDCACQTSMFFLLASPWEKQDMSGPEIFNFNLSSVGPPTVHLPR